MTYSEDYHYIMATIKDCVSEIRFAADIRFHNTQDPNNKAAAYALYDTAEAIEAAFLRCQVKIEDVKTV